MEFFPNHSRFLALCHLKREFYQLLSLSEPWGSDILLFHYSKVLKYLRNLTKLKDSLIEEPSTTRKFCEIFEILKDEHGIMYSAQMASKDHIVKLRLSRVISVFIEDDEKFLDRTDTVNVTFNDIQRTFALIPAKLTKISCHPLTHLRGMLSPQVYGKEKILFYFVCKCNTLLKCFELNFYLEMLRGRIGIATDSFPFMGRFFERVETQKVMLDILLWRIKTCKNITVFLNYFLGVSFGSLMTGTISQVIYYFMKFFENFLRIFSNKLMLGNPSSKYLRKLQFFRNQKGALFLTSIGQFFRSLVGNPEEEDYDDGIL